MKNNNDGDKPQVNDDRRKVVRNLLTGASVTAGVGAAANTAWMKPMINSIMLPAHAQASAPMAATGCCPYYFDVGQSWCYDDGAGQNGNTGPVAGGFSVRPFAQPANCPTPGT